jgi:hypothetical protein
VTARTMAARFGSVCTCGAPIRKGEIIRYVAGMVATHDACGEPTEIAPTRSTPDRRAYGRRGGARGFSTYSTRCTHEDYPCCGCER